MNAITQGAFRTNPIEFLVSPSALGGARIGADGTWTVSLPEILKYGGGPNRAYGGVKSDTLAEVVKANLGISKGSAGNRSMQWAMVAGQMITIPLAFRLGKKLAKPAITRTRRILTQTGLRSTVTV